MRGMEARGPMFGGAWHPNLERALRVTQPAFSELIIPSPQTAPVPNGHPGHTVVNDLSGQRAVWLKEKT